MNPVRTKQANFIYKGPTEDIGDAWVEYHSEVVYMTWELDDDERKFLLDGGNIRLGIWYMKPIPPVSLAVTGEQAVEKPNFKETKSGFQQSWEQEHAG